jgi:hypothetical protein
MTATDDPPLEQLFSAAYEELRRLASAVKRDDRSATLSPTTLVNEAFLKLANDAPRFKALSHLHFKRIVARAMRQVLVEAARRRNADKRGGPGVVFVTWDDSIAGGMTSSDDVIALDVALESLAGRLPFLRRTRCQRDRGTARRVRSDDPAGLARRQSVARQGNQGRQGTRTRGRQGR